MIEKPYGKFTLEQFKHFVDLFHESQKMAPELEKVVKEANPETLKRFLGDNLSWHGYYEMSFIKHMTHGVFILGWQDDVKEFPKQEDPQQALFDFFQKN